MSCCFPRKNNSSHNSVNKSGGGGPGEEQILRNQLLSAYRENQDQREGVVELKAKISILELQNKELMEVVKNNNTDLKTVFKTLKHYKNRARHYKKDNKLLCLHLEKLTRVYPNIKDDESELVSQAIIRNKKTRDNQSNILHKFGSNSSASISSSCNSLDEKVDKN